VKAEVAILDPSQLTRLLRGCRQDEIQSSRWVCREVLERDFTPSQLRLMFAMQPWNKEMNFVFSAKRGLQKKENTFKFFFQNVDVLLAKEPSNLKMEVPTPCIPPSPNLTTR
jgi:hypothetical protein